MRGQRCSATSKRTREQCGQIVLDPGPRPLCRWHGGANPVVNAKRLERLAVARVAEYLPETEPVTAAQVLLDELQRTHQEIRSIGQIVGACANPDEDMPRLLQRWMAERGHARQVAETVLRTGVYEKQLALSDRQGAMLAWFLRGLLGELGFDTTDPAVREIVRRHLLRLQDVEVQLRAMREELGE